jgi:hypothetical protein
LSGGRHMIAEAWHAGDDDLAVTPLEDHVPHPPANAGRQRMNTQARHQRTELRASCERK